MSEQQAPNLNKNAGLSFVVKMFFNAEDKAAVDQAMIAMVPFTLQEPGCITYIGHWLRDEPATLAIYEQYVDEAAFDAHKAAPYFKEWVEGVMVARRIGVAFEYMEMIA